MEESSHDDQDVDRLEDVTDELLDDEQEEIIVKSKRLSLPRRIVEKITSEFSNLLFTVKKKIAYKKKVICLYHACTCMV